MQCYVNFGYLHSMCHSLTIHLHLFCFTVCPEDFKFDPNGPFCHKAILNSAGWVDASSTCQQNGAHLVSIETSQENAYLANTCKLLN